MILPEVVNDESIASNGPGEEYAVGPEGHLDHTPKVARTILVSFGGPDFVFWELTIAYIGGVC